MTLQEAVDFLCLAGGKPEIKLEASGLWALSVGGWRFVEPTWGALATRVMTEAASELLRDE